MVKGRDYHFNSDLAPRQMLARLQEQTGDRFAFSNAWGTVPVYFKLDGLNFTLAKRRRYRDSLAPRFYGVVLERGKGSEVLGHFRPHPLFAAVLCLALLVSGLLALPSQVTWQVHPKLLITPIAFLFTAAALVLSRLAGRNEKAAMLAYVQACCLP